MHLLAATAGRRVEDDGRQVGRNDSDDPSGGCRSDRQVAAATGSGLPTIRHPKGPCQRRDPNPQNRPARAHGAGRTTGGAAPKRVATGIGQIRTTMNYLTEIKLFNEWLETEQLPSNAIVLWYALMFTANRCGWRDEFAVSFSVLQSRTKLDRSTVWRMRKVLTDRGIISVEERGGNRSALYRLHSFERMFASQRTTLTATQSDTNPSEALQGAMLSGTAHRRPAPHRNRAPKSCPATPRDAAPRPEPHCTAAWHRTPHPPHTAATGHRNPAPQPRAPLHRAPPATNRNRSLSGGGKFLLIFDKK